MVVQIPVVLYSGGYYPRGFRTLESNDTVPGTDTTAQASGNAALVLAGNALASGNAGISTGLIALASGNAGISTGLTALASGNVGISIGLTALASGNAGISTGLTALASGNAGLVSASNKVPISGGTMTGDLTLINTLSTTNVKNASSGSNNIVLAADGSTTITTLTGTTITGTSVRGGVTSGTVVASTSGTSIDFTSFPSYVKRITVALQTVSTNGSSNYLIRIGNTTFTITGYASVMNYVNPGANSCTGTSDATGFILSKDTSAGTSLTMIGTIVLLSSGFYVFNFVGNGGVGGAGFFGSGLLNLGSTLDRIRITTINGTDTFDAGSINIFYEG